MKLMTRVKVTGTVIALAVAAGAIAFRDEWGRPDPRTDKEEPVTVHAQWAPMRGTRPILLVVTSETAVLHEDSLVTSPFDKVFWVPKGAVVVAVFEQPTSGPLSCRIDRPNRIGAPKSRETKGKLTCEG